MTSYLSMLRGVRTYGEHRESRAGKTQGVFGHMFVHGMHAGFPLLTTKKVSFRNIVTELLWFLRGDTNIKWLQENKCTIWDAFADKDGNLGPVYGAQWRNFGASEFWMGIDQIKLLVVGINKDPFGRRHVVTAWNPDDLPRMALPPCHMFFQCYVRHDANGQRLLDLSMYQRSADIFLGVPYNIASYALLLSLLAQLTHCTPGLLRIFFGDLHIYENHFPAVDEQLKRTPTALPKVVIPPITKVEDFMDLTPASFDILFYNPQPAIKADVNVGALGGRA